LKNMKNKMTILLGAASAMVLAQATQATPITGVIDISGTATLNNPLGSATAISSYTDLFINSGAQTGAFAPVDAGPHGDTVTMAAFGWNPVTGLPADPLWTFSDPGTGFTYSFDLNSLTVQTQNANFLNITGQGSLSIVGAGSPYTTTAGTWSFTISSTAGGPKADNFSFGFDSETSSVPDGGATVALLGNNPTGLKHTTEAAK
jgi:hypothetical protein